MGCVFSCGKRGSNCPSVAQERAAASSSNILTVTDVAQKDGPPATGDVGVVDSSKTAQPEHASWRKSLLGVTSTNKELAVVDKNSLSSTLADVAEPVAVLCVVSVEPSWQPALQLGHPLGSAAHGPRSIPHAGHIQGSSKPSGLQGACTVRTLALEAVGPAAQAALCGGTQVLCLGMDGGAVALGCMFLNTAAQHLLSERQPKPPAAVNRQQGTEACSAGGHADQHLPLLLHFLADSCARDAMLPALLRDFTKQLLCGQAAPAAHFLPGDFWVDHSYLSLRMTPCAYSVTERPGGAAPSTAPASPRPLLLLPALVLELDAPCQSKQLAARLQLDAAVMSHMPSIVTLFDAQGQVLHQNPSSVHYMGFQLRAAVPRASALPRWADTGAGGGGGEVPSGSGLVSGSGDQQADPPPESLGLFPVQCGVGAGDGCGTALERVFAFAPEQLQEALSAVAEGREWRGVMRVPPSLSPSSCLLPHIGRVSTGPEAPLTTPVELTEGVRGTWSGGERNFRAADPLVHSEGAREAWQEAVVSRAGAGAGAGAGAANACSAVGMPQAQGDASTYELQSPYTAAAAKAAAGTAAASAAAIGPLLAEGGQVCQAAAQPYAASGSTLVHGRRSNAFSSLGTDEAERPTDVVARALDCTPASPALGQAASTARRPKAGQMLFHSGRANRWAPPAGSPDAQSLGPLWKEGSAGRSMVADLHGSAATLSFLRVPPGTGSEAPLTPPLMRRSLALAADPQRLIPLPRGGDEGRGSRGLPPPPASLGRQSLSLALTVLGPGGAGGDASSHGGTLGAAAAAAACATQAAEAAGEKQFYMRRNVSSLERDEVDGAWDEADMLFKAFRAPTGALSGISTEIFTASTAVVPSGVAGNRGGDSTDAAVMLLSDLSERGGSSGGGGLLPGRHAAGAATDTWDHGAYGPAWDSWVIEEPTLGGPAQGIYGSGLRAPSTHRPSLPPRSQLPTLAVAASASGAHASASPSPGGGQAGGDGAPSAQGVLLSSWPCPWPPRAQTSPRPTTPLPSAPSPNAATHALASSNNSQPIGPAGASRGSTTTSTAYPVTDPQGNKQHRYTTGPRSGAPQAVNPLAPQDPSYHGPASGRASHLPSGAGLLMWSNSHRVYNLLRSLLSSSEVPHLQDTLLSTAASPAGGAGHGGWDGAPLSQPDIRLSRPPTPHGRSIMASSGLLLLSMPPDGGRNMPRRATAPSTGGAGEYAAPDSPWSTSVSPSAPLASPAGADTPRDSRSGPSRMGGAAWEQHPPAGPTGRRSADAADPRSTSPSPGTGTAATWLAEQQQARWPALFSPGRELGRGTGGGGPGVAPPAGAGAGLAVDGPARGSSSQLLQGECCWHEVLVRPLPGWREAGGARTSSCSGEAGGQGGASSPLPAVLVIQTDCTSRVRAEEMLVRVLEAEHRLLANIFPRHVLRHMTRALKQQGPGGQPPGGLQLLRAQAQGTSALATHHECISVAFADIKGFTEMSKMVSPEVVMHFLNDLYTRFDSLLDVYGVYKVETIGDCYVVAGGLMSRDEDGLGPAVRGPARPDPLHAVRVVAFARAMLREAGRVALPTTGEPVRVRVGVHSGPATSGVVGQRMPRFCLFGDTMNTASRMESTGQPGAVHISDATRALLPPEEDTEGWAPTGGIQVKGKGTMLTYTWVPPQPVQGPWLGAAAAAAAVRRPRRGAREAWRQRAALLATLREASMAAATGAAAAGLQRAAGSGSRGEQQQQQQPLAVAGVPAAATAVGHGFGRQGAEGADQDLLLRTCHLF